MNLFPNPSSGNTTLSLDVKQKSDFKIVIWDMEGKSIMKEIALGQLDEGDKTIDLDFSSFSNGIYIVELKTTEGSVYNKLLIAK